MTGGGGGGGEGGEAQVDGGSGEVSMAAAHGVKEYGKWAPDYQKKTETRLQEV